MAELPEYLIRPNPLRIVVPQLLLTTVLAFIFYIGILLNVTLLGVKIPGSIQILIVSVLVLLVIVQGLLTYVQTSKIQYSVYKNRIQIEGAKPEYIMFNTIQSVQPKKTFFDKIFNTGTIVIEPKKKISGIPNFDQTFGYLQQMIQYARMQYQQV